MRDEPFSLRLYRRLLKLYPAGFRETYAGPLEMEFRDELAESKGAWALAALWIRLLADLAVSIPVQVSREALARFQVHTSTLDQSSVARRIRHRGLGNRHCGKHRCF